MAPFCQTLALTTSRQATHQSGKEERASIRLQVGVHCVFFVRRHVCHVDSGDWAGLAAASAEIAGVCWECRVLRGWLAPGLDLPAAIPAETGHWTRSLHMKKVRLKEKRNNGGCRPMLVSHATHPRAGSYAFPEMAERAGSSCGLRHPVPLCLGDDAAAGN